MEMRSESECNVGGVDRAVRIGVGTGLIALGLFVPMKRWLGMLVETVGIVSAATGVGQYCPISKAVGRNTCRISRQTG